MGVHKCFIFLESVGVCITRILPVAQTPPAGLVLSTARHARKPKSKPQTAFGKESQKTKSSAIYCRHSDPKRTDMRNDAMCNVQQYKWTFETSSSTQHLSTWIRRVPTYVRGRGGGDLEYHSLAASCGARHSEGTMASQAIESGERRVVQFVRLPSTPKASTSKASTSKARKLKASTPKAWGCATSAQLPKCLPNVLQLGGG